MESFPLVIVFVLIGAAGMAWTFSRGRAVLDRWAARECYELVSATYSVWGGPFWWRRGKGNVVYRVVVRDREGFQRTGYARCGGLFLGLLSDEVNVVWD